MHKKSDGKPKKKNHKACALVLKHLVAGTAPSVL